MYSDAPGPAAIRASEIRSHSLHPENARPHTPEDYRSITLLKTDYKILARLIAARVRPILAELLHPSQYCGVPGNTIFDAVATVRDAIAYVGAHYVKYLWTSNRPLIGSRTLPYRLT